MIAVIGDIHGCYYTLLELLEQIETKHPGIKLYCVGDLVDRGKYSYEVVDYVIKNDIKFTMGNHEYMFNAYINNPNSEMGRAWNFNGAEATLLSYSTRIEEVKNHLKVISKAPLFLNLDDCFISHAGISRYYESKLSQDPLNDIEYLQVVLKTDIESEHGVLWTRDKLIDLGKLQLVGHTRHSSVFYHKTNNVTYIDTSAFTGNKLSAVIVEDNLVIETISIPTIPDDIE